MTQTQLAFPHTNGSALIKSCAGKDGSCLLLILKYKGVLLGIRKTPHIKLIFSQGGEMKYFYAMLASLLLSNVTLASELTAKVNEYFEAQKAVEHKDSKESDVNNLLALLTKDATFEHPRFDAILSKDEYKEGLLNYLGSYGECDIQIKNVIEGLNAVTVEYLHPCTDKEGNSDPEKNKEALVTLFEFKDKKINLIKHYF